MSKMRRNLAHVTGEWVRHWCVSAFSDIRRAWVRGTVHLLLILARFWLPALMSGELAHKRSAAKLTPFDCSTVPFTSLRLLLSS